MLLSKKVVVVGDGMVGKTWLVMALSRKPLPEDYTPTVYETEPFITHVDGNRAYLSLNDTAGQETYDALRPLAYPDTDVFILCFAIDSHDSLENIQGKWLPEIKHHRPTTPFILVGNKEDLRSDTGVELGNNTEKLVETCEGEKMADRIKAFAYLECSAKSKKGIHEVINAAVRVTLKEQKRRRRICQIL